HEFIEWLRANNTNDLKSFIIRAIRKNSRGFCVRDKKTRDKKGREVPMDIGMLWYDDDTKRKLDEKVARAAQYYQTKYGVAPTICYLHPSMLEDKTGAAGGVQLRSARTVLVNHFWIGVNEPITSPELNGHKKKKAR